MSLALHEDVCTPAIGPEIDFSRPFMPEQFTPLFHTPAYRRLTVEQRLRYNQLHALYFNEQIIFFEKALARNVLGQLSSGSLSIQMKSNLAKFMAEEARHSAMFRRLNEQCAPHFYTASDFYFIQISGVARRFMDIMSRRPRLFPLFLWLMLLEEERALHYGATFVRSFGLEPHFVSVQRTHLADEAGHVRWDEELLDCIWAKTNPLLRYFNARLLSWMVDEFFTVPKRAGARVLEELARSLPSTGPALPELRRELAALQRNNRFRASLYPRNVVPRTFSRLQQWPEFAPLLRLLDGQDE